MCLTWLDRLIQFKKESKKTTDEISAISGISRGTLNKLFAGQTKDPQLSTIKAVVHCLGHTLDDLEPLDETNNVSRISIQGLQVAQAYDAAEPRAKEVVRYTLNLPPEKEPDYPVNVVLRPPDNFNEIKTQAEAMSDKISEQVKAHNPIKK